MQTIYIYYFIKYYLETVKIKYNIKYYRNYNLKIKYDIFFTHYHDNVCVTKYKI